MKNSNLLAIKYLGLQDYSVVFDEMKRFTLDRIEKKQRAEESSDEIWLVQHPPVYTQGQAGKPEHMLNPSAIPIIQTDRGGQITYHGPGQIVAYLLLALKHYDLNVRDLVCLQERAIITLLKRYNIDANGSREAPGVYVYSKQLTFRCGANGHEDANEICNKTENSSAQSINGQKIASIGLRIKQGFSYHGLALNVDMDLSPFQSIRPCGLFNMQMTQIKAHAPDVTFAQAEKEMAEILINLLAEKRRTCD